MGRARQEASPKNIACLSVQVAGHLGEFLDLAYWWKLGFHVSTLNFSEEDCRAPEQNLKLAPADLCFPQYLPLEKLQGQWCMP